MNVLEKQSLESEEDYDAAMYHIDLLWDSNTPEDEQKLKQLVDMVVRYEQKNPQAWDRQILGDDTSLPFPGYDRWEEV